MDSPHYLKWSQCNFFKTQAIIIYDVDFIRLTEYFMLPEK